MMTGDSNHLFIEAIHPGIDIFDETGEMRVVWRAQGPQVFFIFQVQQINAYIATRSRISVSYQTSGDFAPLKSEFRFEIMDSF